MYAYVVCACKHNTLGTGRTGWGTGAPRGAHGSHPGRLTREEPYLHTYTRPRPATRNGCSKHGIVNPGTISLQANIKHHTEFIWQRWGIPRPPGKQTRVQSCTLCLRTRGCSALQIANVCAHTPKTIRESAGTTPQSLPCPWISNGAKRLWKPRRALAVISARPLVESQILAFRFLWKGSATLENL